MPASDFLSRLACSCSENCSVSFREHAFQLRTHLFKSLQGLFAIGRRCLHGGIHELLAQWRPDIVNLRHQRILQLRRVELPLKRAVEPEAEEAHQPHQQKRTSQHEQPGLPLRRRQFVEPLLKAVDHLFQIVAAAARGRFVAC
jgi:hypothetical protein